MQRREFISGMLATAAGAAIASPVRSSVGGKMIFVGNEENDSEEEMYKEMFRALCCNVPEGEVVTIRDDEITYIGPNFLNGRNWSADSSNMRTGFLRIEFPSVVQIGVGGLGACFYQCNLVEVDMPVLEKANGGRNFSEYKGVEITLPSLKNFANHDFSYSSTLKVLNLPSCTSRSGSFFVYNDTALEDVYLPQMTLAQLGGASYIAQQQCNSAAVFHLADGDYDYRGNPI